MTTRIRCSAPVTGFLIGSEAVSSRPGTRTRHRCFSSSNENSIGAYSGSRLVVVISDRMWNSVPSACSWPDRIASSASRCRVSARSSMMSWIVPRLRAERREVDDACPGS
jgi:hypothetical protein